MNIQLFLYFKHTSTPSSFVAENQHFFFSQPISSKWARVDSCSRFLDHTQCRAPLDEGSARLRDLFLTKTEHSQQTDIHAPGGIQSRNPSKRSATHSRLRPLGHWDGQKLTHLSSSQLGLYCLRAVAIRAVFSTCLKSDTTCRFAGICSCCLVV